MNMVKFIVTIGLALMPAMALAGGSVGGVPEIPAGAAPAVVAGIMGAVLLIRNRRNKSKKD